ncbi:MAG: hypothetical protein RL459_360, partial [Pseudomonadota bacterium]
MILDGFDAGAIEQAAQAIWAGQLVGLPTETVYGLAADACRSEAVARIFSAKGRPSDHPLIVHVAEPSAVAQFASEVSDFAQRLMTAFWPGPLTLILPRRLGVAAASAGGQDSIGLRCPSHPVAQALLRRLCEGKSGHAVNEPVWGLAAPSANQFGRVSPTTAAHVQGEFGDDLLILDGGACQVGIESTIIDCTRGVPVLLRPGVLTRDELQQACGQRVLLKDELPAHSEPGPRASGTLASHYAPSATVRLMNTQALQSAVAMLGSEPASAPAIGVYARSPIVLSSSACLIR